MNKKTFYDHSRNHLFKGHLTESQVQGMEAILNYYEILDHSAGPKALAYILATVFHETAATMQPIEEYGKGHGRPYGKKLKMGGGPNKRIPYTTPDQLYYGRGFVQVTWYENYAALTRAAKKQGYDWDFLNHPELLLQVEPSTWATFYAMKVGLFTGRKLSDFFTGKTEDPVNARKIINGLDCAKAIAGYYEQFYQALY